jgi:hypothetical protein
MERIDEGIKKRPASDLMNKEKGRELVFMRSSMKKKLKSKIRRQKQKMREELGENAGEEAKAQQSKTTESMRENDETYIEKADEELKEESQNDEFTSYLNKEYDPQILLTTSIKRTGSIFRFMRELKETIPNSYFYYRKKVPLKEIIEMAKEKGFTDFMVVYERLRTESSCPTSPMAPPASLKLRMSSITMRLKSVPKTQDSPLNLFSKTSTLNWASDSAEY